MTMDVNLNEKLKPILNEMNDYFDLFSKDQLSNDDANRLFDLTLKATTIKSFEFAQAVTKLDGANRYFMLPSLRGICEEYITEKFIYDKYVNTSDRNSLIMMWMMHCNLKSSIAQWEYFKSYKPSQTLYYKETFPLEIQSYEKELKEFFKGSIVNFDKRKIFPSVHYMAKSTNLLDIYNYVYHATSTFVHFNPHNLFRMSWGNMPDMTYSTKHFDKYYDDFISYYSSYLLFNILNWQCEIGFLKEFDESLLMMIDDVLKGVKRVPELVTFEEMNIGVITRLLAFKSPDMINK